MRLQHAPKKEAARRSKGKTKVKVDFRKEGEKSVSLSLSPTIPRLENMKVNRQC